MTRLCYSHGTSYPVLSPGYSGYGYAIRDDECIVGFITRISGGTPRPCQPMHLVAIDDLLEFDDTWPPKDQI